MDTALVNGSEVEPEILMDVAERVEDIYVYNAYLYLVLCEAERPCGTSRPHHGYVDGARGA
jgi:hypothetical protein